LPTVAKNEGCGLIVPKSNDQDHVNNPNIRTLLQMIELLGGYVECETEEIMNVMITPTCLMGPMYGILCQNRDWLVKKGVPLQDATYFVGRQYWSMMQDAERGCHDEPNRFDDLVEEQTPGGLNEQVRRQICCTFLVVCYQHPPQVFVCPGWYVGFAKLKRTRNLQRLRYGYGCRSLSAQG
jgi:pyrroline-5-carboxylate reductase